MKHFFTLFVILFAFQVRIAVADADKDFNKLIEKFVPEYQSLKIPDLALSYVENFNKIQSLKGISQQYTFFKKYRSDLKNIDRDELSDDLRYQYDALLYQVRLDLERLRLERRYKEHEPTPMPNDGIHEVPNGREWYLYYVKKWASTELSPTQLMKFGQREVGRIQSEMKSIQKELGYEGKDKEFYLRLNGADFSITNEKELQNKLSDFRSLIFKNLNRDFEQVNIPPVDIKPIPNPTKDSPPGYYDDGVFYYNFFGNTFRKRSLEWLFIHEAVPGHHYQGSVAPSSSPIQKLFWYPGFTEGWAAYTEDIGKDLDGYQDPYMYYGKWEWDLVRSARVILDVGINYFGWSKPQALKFWKDNITNQDGIAVREVDRMFRWPAQVLAYKVGERKFLELREDLKKVQRGDFDLKRFHSLVLERGSIPLPVLDEIVNDQSFNQSVTLFGRKPY